MYIEQAVINYNQRPPIYVWADDARIKLVQGDQTLELINDELIEIIRLAELLQWEGIGEGR